jgi:hypothetical protein
MARLSLLPKVVLWIAALVALAVLFLRSLQSTREEPFIVEPEGLTSWTLVVEPERDAFGAWLALQPPPRLTPSLGRQIFSRAGESVHYPNPPSIPLVLRTEVGGALAGGVTSDAVVNLARAEGLDSPTFQPRCMARRRVSEPGSTRSLFFIVYDAPAFGEFRQALAARLRSIVGQPAFDPAALSPALIVASTDENFRRWLPLRVNPDVDCMAPIEVQ